MEEDKLPKWKKFEQLVHKIQADLAPDAKVILNDKIIGARTGVERQIDISVRKQIGQYTILIVIDCKDYKTPADVKDVEGFLGLVEDVGANKGALVAANGFTEAAKTRAKDKGIDLYRLVDAENRDWSTYAYLPMVCDFRGLGQGRFVLRGPFEILMELKEQDPKQIKLFDSTHREIGTPLTLLRSKWNKREIPDEPGDYVGLSVSSEPTFVQSKSGDFVAVRIEGNFAVERRLFFSNLPLTKILGLRDEISGNFIMPGNFEIITDVLDMQEVERSWLRIPSIEALAVKPVIILVALDQYPEESGGEPKGAARARFRLRSGHEQRPQ